MGLTWEEVEASAQDRQTWRQRVALCIGERRRCWMNQVKSSQVKLVTYLLSYLLTYYQSEVIRQISLRLNVKSDIET